MVILLKKMFFKITFKIPLKRSKFMGAGVHDKAELLNEVAPH